MAGFKLLFRININTKLRHFKLLNKESKLTVDSSLKLVQLFHIEGLLWVSEDILLLISMSVYMLKSLCALITFVRHGRVRRRGVLPMFP